MTIAKDFSSERYAAWYMNPLVQKALTYHLMYREAAVIGENLSVRNIKVRESAHLLENIRRFELTANPVNWYYSLAILNKMPIFSFRWDERKIQSEMFKQNFLTFMAGYDFALDLDAHGGDHFGEALADAQKVHDWMSSESIPHSVRFSGSGFHIVIYSNMLWQPPFHFRPALAPTLCAIIAEGIVKELNLKSADTSVYDERRIWKCPYSLDIKTMRICRPLNDDELRRFSYELVSPEYCLKNASEVFYNRKSFSGSSRNLHKFIFRLFDGRADTSMRIWSLIEKRGVHAVDDEILDDCGEMPI